MCEGAGVYIKNICLSATDPLTTQVGTEKEALKAADSEHDKFTSQHRYFFHLMRKKSALLVLHSMKQGISHHQKRTPNSSASRDWKCKNSAFFFFFWHLQPLPLLIWLRISINAFDTLPPLQHDWLRTCAIPKREECGAGCVPITVAAVPLPPAAHHGSLAGSYRRLSGSLFPRPATPLSHPGFHSQPHSWWWTLSHPGNQLVLLLLCWTRGTQICVSRAVRTDTASTAHATPAKVSSGVKIVQGQNLVPANTCSRKTRQNITL